MQETDHLLGLIGDVYDATLDRSTWPDVLRKLSKFVEGASASVFWNDAASLEGDVYFEDGGIDPYWRDLYFGKYVKLNPITTPRFFAAAEEPISTADLVDYDEFLKSRFYREWAQPQRLVDFVSVTLEKTTPKAAMFGVFRHERNGVVDEGARYRMRQIAPHIRRAVLISKIISFKQNEAAMLAQTLDGLRAAVILVDAEARIVHANAAAHALIDAGDVIRSANGRLAETKPESGASFRDTLVAAAAGDAALGTRGIALPLMGKAGDRYVVHVLPLTSGSRRQTGRTHTASAAIFIHHAALDVTSPPVAIVETYKFTMMELRVLLGIVEVGGVSAVAEMLGVARSTVKSHLTRIFEKTGTSRQADLVKLVAGFLGPLASQETKNPR